MIDGAGGLLQCIESGMSSGGSHISQLVGDAEALGSVPIPKVLDEAPPSQSSPSAPWNASFVPPSWFPMPVPRMSLAGIPTVINMIRAESGVPPGMPPPVQFSQPGVPPMGGPVGGVPPVGSGQTAAPLWVLHQHRQLKGR